MSPRRIETPAAFRFEMLDPRDLTITSVERAVELKENHPGHDGRIGAAQKKERAANRKNENEQGPSAWRNRILQKLGGDGAGDGPIQIARNQTVLRFATATKKL